METPSHQAHAEVESSSPDETVARTGLRERLRAKAQKAGVSQDGYRDDLPGIYFRSRWEANYARYLNRLKLLGEIRDWAHEPETFWFLKIQRGVRSYKPDFRVEMMDGSHHYVEVKGYMDPRSRTKLKRMRIHHPKVDVRLVDEAAYKLLEKEIGPLVTNWEFPPPRPSRAREKPAQPA